MTCRDMRFRKAEERAEEMAEALYQQRRIVEDEVLEAERLITERGYAVIAFRRTPVVARTLDEFMLWQAGVTPPRGMEVFVPPPDPKPVFAPRAHSPQSPPRGPRREYRR